MERDRIRAVRLAWLTFLSLKRVSVASALPMSCRNSNISIGSFFQLSTASKFLVLTVVSAHGACKIVFKLLARIVLLVHAAEAVFRRSAQIHIIV